MTRISVRRDGEGRQAVYCGGTLLLNGLAEAEARTFAAFFRAADRVTGGKAGSVAGSAAGASASPGGRSRAPRSGVTAARGGRPRRALP